MNRWVTILGLVISVCGFIASIFPESHKVGIAAGIIGAVAAAIGKQLWPEHFRNGSPPSVLPPPESSPVAEKADVGAKVEKVADNASRVVRAIRIIKDWRK